MRPLAARSAQHRIAGAALAWGLVILGAYSHAADPEKSAVLGRVGDTEVTAADVRAALAGLTPREQARVAQDGTLLNQVLRSYLVQRIVLAEARSKNWEQSPGVQAQLERARENALTESYLQAMSQPPDSYPGEAELLTAYNAAKPSLLVPRSYRLAQIFISASKNGSDDGALKEARAKLDAVYKKLLALDADFATIAKADSEDPQSAAQGGEIGWLAENQIQPEIFSQLPKLSLNALSHPIQLNDGWHVLKVLDVREPYTPTLEQVRTQLREQLRAERTRTNTQAFLTKLMQAHPVTLDETALSKPLPHGPAAGQ